MSEIPTSFLKLVSRSHLQAIRDRMARLYGKEDVLILLERLYFLIGRYGMDGVMELPKDLWSEEDVVLITYADQVKTEGEPPLQTLERFCTENLEDLINTIHILPFCPWSSDDGFSVIDYRQVAQEYGDWEDVQKIGESFNLMFDLVLNHCSIQSQWFRDFQIGIQPARHYFHERNPGEDLSAVVRPRTTPLLTSVHTREGETFVWTTFSADQVDLNWANPDVLFEFLDILLDYISKGCRIIRLDAIAFLWKKKGTDCLHLEETHEVVKLIRDFLEIVAPDVILLTETNVPHEENISYFGDGEDEAHMVYQFSLPPLLLHGLLEGTSQHLREWAASLPELPPKCTFLNFTASHDGIGVRPLQDILTHKQILALAKKVKQRGGKVSSRTLPDGSESPYELNITYLSALDDPKNPELGMQRFLCSQVLALSLQGVPALYFQSLIGAENDLEGLQETGRNRTINRKKWDEFELGKTLAHLQTRQSQVFAKIQHFLRVRIAEPAFHPNATQEVLDYGDSLFGVLREALTGESSILCLYNFTSKPQKVPALETSATDLLSEKEFPAGDAFLLEPYQAVWLRYN